MSMNKEYFSAYASICPGIAKISMDTNAAITVLVLDGDLRFI